MFFFYGTLRHRPLLQTVLGRDPGPLMPAVLPGHEVCWIDGQHVPLIRRGDGRAEGVLFEPGPDDAARLDAYEHGFGYETAEVTVETAAGPQQARVYYPDPRQKVGAPFRLEEWEARWAPVAVPAAAEFMRRWDAGQPIEVLERFFPGMEARAWASHLAARAAPTTLRKPGNPTEFLQEHQGFEGFFRFRHMDLRHRRFDGSWTPPFTRECFVGFDAALVLPYDAATDRVLLVEQLRLATAVRGDPNPHTLEPIAGLIEAGEEPEACARREAREEAGLELAALELIGRVYPSPGYSTEFHHCYLGHARLDGIDKRIGGADGEHEDIRSHVLPLEAAVDLIATGEVNVAPLAMMLLWTLRHRDRLRAVS